MKYYGRKDLNIFILILIVSCTALILCITEKNYIDKETIEVMILTVLVIITLIYLNIMIKIRELPKKNGKALKGYIIDVECADTRFLFAKRLSGAIKIRVNEKIIRIAGIKMNKKYKELYNRMNEMYYIDDRVNIKGIPIDVYINEDDIYADLESVDV